MGLSHKCKRAWSARARSNAKSIMIFDHNQLIAASAAVLAHYTRSSPWYGTPLGGGGPPPQPLLKVEAIRVVCTVNTAQEQQQAWSELTST